MLLSRACDDFPRLRLVWADQGYRGQDFTGWAQQTAGVSIQIAVRRDGGLGRTWTKAGAPPRQVPRFAVVPRRWVVERTLCAARRSVVSPVQPGGTWREDKTLITHARTGAARFLGYEIIVQHNSSKATRRRRSVNGQVALRVPLDVIKAKSAPYLWRGKPAKQKALTNGSDHTIVATYGAIYRGIVQYYLLAGDVFRLHRLRWVMETSMLKTLAGKHRSSMSRMAAKHKVKIQTPHGPRTCFEARLEREGRQPLVARFGDLTLHRQKTATVTDRQPIPVDYPRKELIARLLADTCEICQQTGEVQVHHVRKLADLQAPGPLQPQWAKAMANRRRKTLVVCATCHDLIHRNPARPLTQ
ncbi:group II intron reverse transcriptase/maturase [Spirillospora sp. CA-255316]